MEGLRPIEIESIENVSLYIGDCIHGMKQLPDESIDLVIADPPYNLGKGIVGDKMGKQAYLKWTKSWLVEAARVLKPTGSIWVMCSVKFVSYIYMIMEDDLGLHHINTIAWAYKGSTHGAKYQMSHSYEPILLFTKSKEGYTFNMDLFRDRTNNTRHDRKNNPLGKALEDVWQGIEPVAGLMITGIDYLRWNHPERYKFYDRRTNKGAHPTQKPLSLVVKMIALSSNKNDVVVAPFLGSGTTAVACIGLDRTVIGYEIDEKWEKMIVERVVSARSSKSRKLDAFISRKKSLDKFL